eukprot:3335736-Pleurochrysis_carterae.AAC.3
MTRFVAMSVSICWPFSSDWPSEMHIAIEAPIDVPQIKSNISRIGRPAQRISMACSTCVGLSPLTPPPSMHRMRSGRACAHIRAHILLRLGVSAMRVAIVTPMLFELLPPRLSAAESRRERLQHRSRGLARGVSRDQRGLARLGGVGRAGGGAVWIQCLGVSDERI